MSNYQSVIYNYISEANNAKIIYVTNQSNHCDASNILNSKNKVINIHIYIIYFIYLEYLAFLFRSSSRNYNRHNKIIKISKKRFKYIWNILLACIYYKSEIDRNLYY